MKSAQKQAFRMDSGTKLYKGGGRGGGVAQKFWGIHPSEPHPSEPQLSLPIFV